MSRVNNNAHGNETLRIGWACVDITPPGRVNIQGQFNARVSEGVADPLSATAMAFESVREEAGTEGLPARGVMVSCDLIGIASSLSDRVRAHVRADLPELDPDLIVLNATHTHCGPDLNLPEDQAAMLGRRGESAFGVELDVMDPADYNAFVARRIADAVIEAWRGREVAAMGFGLGQATIGYNRRMTYDDGRSVMYGNANDPTFAHIEGSQDTSVNVVGFWNQQGKLTGIIVNLACPSQLSEHEFQISADFWYETRHALRKQLGEDLFILPQCSAAGDLAPPRSSTVIGWPAQERMWRLMGVTVRQAVADRITAAVVGVLPYAHQELDWNPVVQHRAEQVPLTRRLLSEADVRDAQAEAEQWNQKYEALKRELEEHPEKHDEPRWYVPVTTAYRRMRWYRGVAERHELEKTSPKFETSVHIVRLGDVALATNQFEYYLDFSHQIRTRTKAVQTLLVQLAGAGGYLPTPRTVAGGGYGAVPASTTVGPEGGRELANWTIDAINAMWSPAPAAAPVA